MQITLNIPIKAKCITPSVNDCSWLKHDLEVNKIYAVRNIEIGSCYTSVELENGKIYNSVYLEFYYKDKKIDIYKSPILNRYLKLPIESLVCLKK